MKPVDKNILGDADERVDGTFLKHDADIRKDRPALYDKLAAIRAYKEQGKF